MITQTLTLDMIPGKEPQDIHINQNDKGNQIVFTLTKDGAAYTPTGTYTIQGVKPSGKFSVVCTKSNNKVIATLTEAITSDAGKIPCQILETDGTNKTGSQLFMLNIQRRAYDNTNV